MNSCCVPDCSAVTGQRLIDDCNEAIRDAIDSTAQLSIESGYSSDEDDAATASTAAGDTSSAPTVADDVDGGGVPVKSTLKSPCVPKDVMGVDNKLYIVLSKKRTLSLELPMESDDGDVLTSGCRPGQQQQQRPVDNVGFDPYPPMDCSPHSFMSSSSEPTYSPKPVFLGAPSPRPSSHRSGSVGSRHSSASLVDNSSSSRHNSVSSHATPSSSPHERLSSTDSASPAAARNSIDNSVTAATQHHQNNVIAAAATAAAASRAASSSSLNSSSIPVSTVPGHTATSIKQTVSATAAAVPTVAPASGQQSLGSFNQVPASTSSTVTSDASRRALLEQLNRQMAAIPQQTSVHSQTFVAKSSQQSNSFSNWANPHQQQQQQQQHVDVSQPYFNGGGSGGGGGGGGGGCGGGGAGVADNRLLVNLLQQKAAPLNGFSHSKVRREIAGYCGGGGGDVTDYNDNSYSSAFSAADWSSLQSMVIGGGGGGPAVAYHHGAAESQYSQVSGRFLVTRD